MKTLKIGTRGSDLALLQANMVRAALAKQWPKLETEIVVIRTSGDWSPGDGEVRLKEMDGGKGQFAKEIEEALLKKDIDIAVHSMKDMDSHLPSGLVISHMLPREDPRDVLLFNELAEDSHSIYAIAHGATVGTASVRRQAFLLARRPDLNVVPLRGNVLTRIEKLKAGQVDVTLLALAGLKRLGLEHHADVVLALEDMLPAAGQGAVGIERRLEDDEVASFLDPISCMDTVLRVSAERAALKVLDGSCHTPIGAHATLDGESMTLKVCLAALDGSDLYDERGQRRVRTLDDATALGIKVGQSIKAKAPAALLRQSAL